MLYLKNILPPTGKNGALDFKKWKANKILNELEQKKPIKLKLPFCDNSKFVWYKFVVWFEINECFKKCKQMVVFPKAWKSGQKTI